MQVSDILQETKCRKSCMFWVCATAQFNLVFVRIQHMHKKKTMPIPGHEPINCLRRALVPCFYLFGY